MQRRSQGTHLSLSALMLVGTVAGAQASGNDTGKQQVVQLGAASNSAAPAVALAPTAPQQDLRYELGPGDKLRVTVHSREDISGEFQVRLGNKIAVPLLGLVDLNGKDVYDLERELSERLPGASVVVEILERRPFYVLGRVTNPGAYPFVPGMTVLHAIAYAGGAPRLRDNTASLSMTMLSRVESQNNARRSLILDLSRYDLLRAERAKEKVVTASPELVSIVGADRAKVLTKAATALLKQRAEVRAETRKSLERQVRLGREEIGAYQNQLDRISERQRLTDTSLKNLQKLLNRNLTVRSRVFDMQRSLSQAREGDQRVQAEIARAKRLTARAESDLAILDTRHQNELDQEIQTLQARITSAMSSFRASEAVLEQLPASVVQMARAVGQNNAAGGASYTILRLINGKHVSIAANEVTRLVPGDLIRVK